MTRPEASGRLRLAAALIAVGTLGPAAGRAAPPDDQPQACAAWRLQNSCQYFATGSGAFAAAWQGQWHVTVERGDVLVENLAGDMIGAGFLDTQAGDLVTVEAKLPPQCEDVDVPPSTDPDCQELGSVIAGDTIVAKS